MVMSAVSIIYYLSRRFVALALRREVLAGRLFGVVVVRWFRRNTFPRRECNNEEVNANAPANELRYESEELRVGDVRKPTRWQSRKSWRLRAPTSHNKVQGHSPK